MKAGTAKRSKAITPEVVEPENPNVALARNDANVITEWATTALWFFREANELEVAAKGRLEKMSALQTPTNSADDAHVQDLVRLSNAGQKATIEHWYITGVFDKMHKWAVQGRKRATDADVRAAEIGNRLHAIYGDQERLRAREEEDRLRREAEARARQARQAELDRLEAEALKAEASSPTLSGREAMFVDLIVAGHDYLVAATRAGYADPGPMGGRLLTRDKIRAAIEMQTAAKRMRQQAVAVKAAPVEVETLTVQPDIQKGGDRTTYSAELFDERALVNAILQGGGIPTDLLRIDTTKLNEYARSLRENINRWPGVRLKKNTRVV